MSAGLLVFLLICALPFIAAMLVYNHLVGMRNAFRNAFSQIDVQLKRRHDLVPGLVEVARAYLKHERQTLESVVAARQSATAARALAAMQPSDVRAMGRLDVAEQTLTTAVTKMFGLVEAYPDLKADATLAHLTEELSSTENRIGFARQSFNDAVTDYNTAVERFPVNVVSIAFGFRPARLLQATCSHAERQPVAVRL